MPTNTDLTGSLDEIERTIERTVFRLANNISNKLAEVTPVDTGWAKGNWWPSIGSPINEPAPNPGTEGAAARAEARRQALVMRLVTYRLDDGNVFIQNNVPYITRLAQGSSPDQPNPGWIEAVIDEQVEAVRNAVDI